jgi:hypothetical protein
MGKLTISMAIFNSYVKLPEGKVCGPKNFDLTHPHFWDFTTSINGNDSGSNRLEVRKRTTFLAI